MAATNGMLRTRNACESSGFSSELTFTTLTLPAYWAPTFSRIGVSARHGPHQGAQKSITTGMPIEASITSASKVAVVTSITSNDAGAAVVAEVCGTAAG